MSPTAKMISGRAMPTETMNTPSVKGSGTSVKLSEAHAVEKTALLVNAQNEKGTGTGETCSDASSADGEINYHLSQDMADRLVFRTEARLSQILEDSAFVKRQSKLYDLPQFCDGDLNIGPLIAKGGFSNVHAIDSFNKKSDLRCEKQYVVKALNPKLALNPRKLQSGARDLVKEAHFISALDHENIIKLRGWSDDGVSSFSTTGRADGFFLIYDKLECTLFQRLHSWFMEARGTNINELQRRKMCSVAKELYTERIEVAYQVAKALAYLHDNRIVHMDVKPGNIGFTSRGRVKLFDFGLATELPPSQNPNQTFALPNHTGTPRFMAPEIITKNPFNCKADVYSFSIVLWEMLALQKPYEGYSGETVKQLVGVFDDRPEIPSTWPKNVKKLLRRSWTRRIGARPSMEEVRDTLGKILDPQQPSSARRTLFWFRR